MSQEGINTVGFGFVDDTDESLRTKSGGKFGLNQGAFLTKFELNENAGKDQSKGDALDITVQVGDKKFMNRIYPTTRVFDNDGNEIEDKTSDEYKKKYNEDWTQKNAVIVHILKCFRTEDEIRKAFAANPSTFAEFINICAALLPDNFSSQPLDVFLEYQWQIASGQDRTFLQLPKNMKGGYFLVKEHKPEGKWEEIREDGLRYVDDKNGAEHPFTRSENFMASPKSYLQKEGEDNNAEALAGAAGGTAKPGEKW